LLIQAVIVDDEPAHRFGLERHVDWNGLGYDAPLLAESGDEALALLGQQTVHVLIADIRMPGMDGIELVREARERCPTLQVLIVSGHDEFEFAQGAIEAGAKAYLLKPVELHEVQKWLTTFRESLLLYHRILDEEQHTAKRIQDITQMAREKFLEDVIYNGALAPSELARHLKLLDIDSERTSYMIVIISPDDYFRSSPDHALIPKVLNAIGVALSEYVRIGIRVQPDQIALMIIRHEGDDDFPNSIEEKMELVQSVVHRELKESLSISIGRPSKEWSDITVMYQETVDALFRARFAVKGQIISVTDGVNPTFAPFSAENTLSQVSRAIENGDEVDLIRRLTDVFDRLGTESEQRFTYAQALCVGLVSEFVRRSVAHGGGAVAEAQPGLWQQVLGCSTVAQLRRTTMELGVQFCRDLARASSKRRSQLIEKAISFMKDNLHRDVGLKDVANEVHLNSSYLSVLFKKETGETLSSFLSRMRLERARDLLKDPRVKVYEVAGRVGYQTASYFTHQFKKAYGCTPNEFRDSARSKDLTRTPPP